MTAAKKTAQKIKLKLIRSLNRRQASHRACVNGLGLKKINQVVEVLDTPENRGMFNKVSYMVEMIDG